MVKVPRILPKDNKMHTVYQDGYHLEFLLGLKRAVLTKNTSAVIIYDGKSGMGKSTKSFQDAIILDKDFGLHKIHTLSETFIKGGEGKVGLSQAKKGDCIVYDEAMVLSSRSAMSELNKTIVQAMSMIRSKQIFVLFNINSIFDLDRNLVLSRADALIHLYGQHLYDRGKYAVFFKARDGEDRLKSLYLSGKKFYSYAQPQSNYVGQFTKEFIVDEVEYEKQKQEGIVKFLSSKVPERVPKSLKQRDKLIIHLYEKLNRSVKEIAEIIGLDPGAVYLVLSNHRNMVEQAFKQPEDMRKTPIEEKKEEKEEKKEDKAIEKKE